MTFDKRLPATLAAFICLALAMSAMAQDLTPSTTRGTVKVQSRLFNPFDVSQSRLSIDPFGFFTLQRSSVPSGPVPILTSSQKVQSLSSSPAVASATDKSSTDSTAAPTANIGSSAAVLDPSTIIAVGAARPPFRPPVRSPFRPPPRPPF
jgi:hypothetical protein